MHHTRQRWFLALGCLLLGAAVTWSVGRDGPAGDASGPPPAPALYHPDPQQLWNRLHRALWVRVGPDGKTYGDDRLDPLLWMETKYLLQGRVHEQAIAVLDEFLAQRGERLVKDPLKRAILQRDLWAVFDWTAEPGATTQDARLGRTPLPRRALQVRLARVIQRLVLTAEEIKGLPDNYAAAVASRAFAEEYDPVRPERPFLPPDLFMKDGPWVEIQDTSDVIASRHAFDFGYRSAFRVFLRFPEGRKATIAYLARLWDFPRPWVPTREPGNKRDTLVLNPGLPQFPVGTQAALVRQMLLIDKGGRIATTRVTESVQLRVFRAVPKRNPEMGRPPNAPPEQDFYEFTRSRVRLFAGKTGGLRPLGPNDKDYRTQFVVLPVDELESHGEPQSVMETCLGCHDRPGIFSFRSYTGGEYPRGQYYLPDLRGSGSSEVSEGKRSASRKREQYSWGLLQGLWEDLPRR